MGQAAGQRDLQARCRGGVHGWDLEGPGDQ